MMDTMLNDNGISFKDLEKKIYAAACRWARDYTRQFLEEYDVYLSEHRDKKAYRNKGLRKTVVKTVFGEVEYQRHIYQTIREDGSIAYVYLLDEELTICGVGKISQNMAQQLVNGITDMSYRNCAKHVSETTGQTISPMGVWNVVQALGEQICEEETALAKAHKAGNVKGDIDAPVLFEEVDGVYLNLQREKARRAEMKVAIAYDGWKDEGNGRYSLSDKVVAAGFSGIREFREHKDAIIAEKYDMDGIQVRILNGDGAGWIRKSCTEDTVFQLDPFHRNKAIRECIGQSSVRAEIQQYLDKQDIKGMFERLYVYRNSLSEADAVEKADQLIKYFKENTDGLIPWMERGLEITEENRALIYRGMGTMENHIWSVIARRMKHNHTSWSIHGANCLAKILAKKGSGRLGEVADKLKTGRFGQAVAEEIGEKLLSAGRTAQKEGKGYIYPVIGSIPISAAGLGKVSRRFWNEIKGI